jgi:hypothetical protein
MNIKSEVEYVVVSDEAMQVARIMDEHGFAAPKWVEGLPEEWWKETLPLDKVESIAFSPAVKLIALLRENGVEFDIELWHPPHEKPVRPEEPEGVEIPWNDIGKFAVVVAKACLMAIAFLGMMVLYGMAMAFSAIDPWLVLTLKKTGERLCVLEWTE